MSIPGFCFLLKVTFRLSCHCLSSMTRMTNVYNMHEFFKSFYQISLHVFPFILKCKCHFAQNKFQYFCSSQISWIAKINRILIIYRWSGRNQPMFPYINKCCIKLVNKRIDIIRSSGILIIKSFVRSIFENCYLGYLELYISLYIFCVANRMWIYLPILQFYFHCFKNYNIIWLST